MLVALLDRYSNRPKVLTKIMKIISSIIFNGNFLEKNKNIDENITG
jgi:hypothetical protein